MSKHWKPKKQSVALEQPVRVSRIRRDPVPKAKPKGGDGAVQWRSSEREIWIAIIGIVAFALAIDIIVIAVGAYWN